MRLIRGIGGQYRKSALARGVGRVVVVGAVLLMVPLTVRAVPPADDWTLEHGDDDRVLNEHRLDALRRSPFSNSQWRALGRALSERGRARLIERRLAKTPTDAALVVLSARVLLDAGQPAEAVERLSADAVRSSRFAAKALLLQSRTLDSLSLYARAATVLLVRTANMSEGTRRQYLGRAFELASRHGLTSLAREIADTWTFEFPTSGMAWSSRAAVAEASANFTRAADAYGRAVRASSRSARRVEWTKAQARALALANVPQEALARLSSLLEDPRALPTFESEDWADLLRYARAANSLASLGATLEAAMDHGPLHGTWRAYWTRAKIAVALGEPSAPYWKRGVRASPRNATLSLGLMTALERAGDIPAVLKVIEGWRRYDSEFVDGALAFATRARAIGDGRAADRVLEHTRRLSRRHPEGLRSIRDYVNAHGDLTLGLVLSKRICQLSPHDAVARRRLGDQYYQMDRLDDAVRTWNEIAELTRPRHEGWRMVAEIFLSQSGRGKPRVMREHAARAVERGLALAPDDAGLHRMSGLLAEHRRDSVGAYAAWIRVLEVADATTDTALRAEARSRIVDNVFRLPKRQRRESLLRQLEDDSFETLEHGKLPAQIGAALTLAEIYTRQHRREDVVGVWRRLVEVAPRSREVLLHYGRALRHAGRYADAINVLRDLAARGGEDRSTPLLLLAELHVQHGDADAAITYAERAAAASQTPTPSIRTAAALRQRGDITAARTALEGAARMFPEHPAPVFELGMLSMTTGDLSGAASSFQTALSKHGDDYISKRAGSMALSLMSLMDREAEFLSTLAKSSSLDSSRSSRELVAQTLDLMTDTEVQRWQRDHPAQSRHIERELIRAFRIDPVTARANAAQTLGRLGAEAAGRELVRVATQLTTPASLSRTERRQLDRLRWEALLAAGSIDERPSLEPLRDAALTSRDSTVELAATWALANSDHSEVHSSLRRLLEDNEISDLKRALICVGLARASLRRGALPAWSLRPQIERARTLARTTTAITACEIANAIFTQDSLAPRLLPLLWGDDEDLVEVLVWRLGRTRHAGDNPAIGEALWRTYLSSSGRLHRIARSAVARFYRGSAESPVPPRLDRTSLNRLPGAIATWSRALLHASTPDSPWSADARASAHSQLERAVHQMRRGPRHERVAIEAWSERCAMRNPLPRGPPGDLARETLLKCLLGGDQRPPPPEQTNASAAR